MGRSTAADGAALQAFLLDLGRALSLAGTAVSETQTRLTTVAAAGGAPKARVVVLPTALIVAVGRHGPASIESIPQIDGALRLDQIHALYALVDEAERGAIAPGDGMRRLRVIRAMRPRLGSAATVAAYSAMTLGLCLVLQPTPGDLVISALFGVAVGTLVLVARRRRALTPLVPVIAAILVSAASFEAVKRGVADPGLRTLIPPLVTFLPGGALATATVELASGEMVAGASRLVFGAVQLLLLAFGIVAGVELVGLPSDAVTGDEPANLLGWWAPWLGVIVFGCAAAAYSSAPPGALPWLLLVLMTAWVGQLAGSELVGPEVSGFFGALAMAPLALAIGGIRGAPPSQVTFLPAFWLLVPGAIGLIGVTEVVGDPASASLEVLVTPVGAVVSIALGVLAGVSLHRALAPVAGPPLARLLRVSSRSAPPGSRR
jgi:uncharacterized membrane protein YjjP (DUF1212 family)